MRTEIHPTYHPAAKVVCSCGTTFTTGSTVSEIHTELCSACHPFYTGQTKTVDSARRVDRFQRRTALQETVAAARTGRRVKKERAAARRKEKSEALGAEK
ncbi:50S ribosomal protein L31 [Candidatus Uhrbacteria bacterium]|nr:50S ribosomal protein L31 [Candidatus Uhrbacteria bacterium]